MNRSNREGGFIAINPLFRLKLCILKQIAPDKQPWTMDHGPGAGHASTFRRALFPGAPVFHNSGEGKAHKNDSCLFSVRASRFSRLGAFSGMNSFAKTLTA